jgi:hypothetical protein
MPDPPPPLIPVIASLIIVGTKASTQLDQLIGAFRTIPSEINQLSKSLSELCATLQRLEKAILSGYEHNIRDVLDGCIDIFLQLHIFVDKLRDGVCRRKLKKWWR